MSFPMLALDVMLTVASYPIASYPIARVARVADLEDFQVHRK